MRAKFIDGLDGCLALELLPETDDERLLVKQFSRQSGAALNRLRIQGWSHDAAPGLRAIRIYIDHLHPGETENKP